MDIVWRVYELYPESGSNLVTPDYVLKGWRDSVYPLAEKLGIRIKMPPMRPRTRSAHEAAHWARQQGRFDVYHEAVFRALFEQGEDISDVGVLTSLAAELGMAYKKLNAVLKNRDLEHIVLADYREARKLGVSSVPAFLANRRAALIGVQTVENLKSMVEHVRASAMRPTPSVNIP